MKLKDLTGQKFGRLLVIKRGKSHIQPNGKPRVMWLCKCDCGNSIEVRGSDLKSNKTKSCGCYNHEKIMERNYTHRMSKTHIYNIWRGMKDRCYNPNHQKYEYYGGKGIKTCVEWLIFENFYKDMKESYDRHCKEYGEHQTTIDRINVNKDYCKDNCRWATYRQQSLNKNNTSFVEYQGKKIPLSILAQEYNINRATLYNRIFIMHWNIEKALKTKPKKVNKNSNKIKSRM